MHLSASLSGLVVRFSLRFSVYALCVCLSSNLCVCRSMDLSASLSGLDVYLSLLFSVNALFACLLDFEGLCICLRFSPWCVVCLYFFVFQSVDFTASLVRW